MVTLTPGCLRQHMLAATVAVGGQQGARTSLQRKIQALSLTRVSLSSQDAITHPRDDVARLPLSS